MGKTNGIYVYAHDATDMSNTGLVGDLKPLEAVFQEEKNGISQVVLKLPYDKYKKWKACEKGNIIKALVPVRVPSLFDSNGGYSGQVKVYKKP